MKQTSIERHCRNCDHSKIDVHNSFNMLRCTKGEETKTLSQGQYGTSIDNKATSCPMYDPSKYVALEESRGFDVTVL